MINNIAYNPITSCLKLRNWTLRIKDQVRLLNQRILIFHYLVEDNQIAGNKIKVKILQQIESLTYKLFRMTFNLRLTNSLCLKLCHLLLLIPSLIQDLKVNQDLQSIHTKLIRYRIILRSMVWLQQSLIIM